MRSQSSLAGSHQADHGSHHLIGHGMLSAHTRWRRHFSPRGVPSHPVRKPGLPSRARLLPRAFRRHRVSRTRSRNAFDHSYPHSSRAATTAQEVCTARRNRSQAPGTRQSAAHRHVRCQSAADPGHVIAPRPRVPWWLQCLRQHRPDQVGPLCRRQRSHVARAPRRAGSSERQAMLRYHRRHRPYRPPLYLHWRPSHDLHRPPRESIQTHRP